MTSLAFSLGTGAALHLRDIRPQVFPKLPISSPEAAPSSALDRPLPPTRRIIVTSLVVGPLVGAVAAWLVLSVYTLLYPFPSNTVTVFGWLSFLLVAIPVGYIVGFVPSLIAGVVNAGLADSELGLTGRLIVAVPLGLLTTWLCWFWFILSMPSYNLPVVATMFTVAGVTGCPAALWVASRPRRNTSSKAPA